MNKFKQSYQSRNSVASSTPYITTCYCYFNAQVHYPLGRSQYSRGQDHQLYTTGWREEQNGSYSCLTKRSGGQTKSVSHMTGMFITLARKGMKLLWEFVQQKNCLPSKKGLHMILSGPPGFPLCVHIQMINNAIHPQSTIAHINIVLSLTHH